MKLTKLDTAKRQLVTAIRLFLDDRDPVSIYSLASNAWEIIDELCRKRQVDNFSNLARSNLEPGKDLKVDYINNPFRNFFKHADKDHDKELDGFEDTHNDHLLYITVADLLKLLNKSPLECQVYQVWYIALYKEKFGGDDNEIVITASNAFPSMDKLSRIEQKKIGREILSEVLNNPELVNDLKTDRSEISRWK